MLPNFGILQGIIGPQVVGQIPGQQSTEDDDLGDLLSGLKGLIGTKRGMAASTQNTQPSYTYGANFNHPSLQEAAIMNQLGFNHGGKTDVSQIIFHDTAGPTLKSALDTLKQRKLSYNYIIDKDGSIHNLVPPGTKAYHAKGYNENTVGVSFVGGGAYGPVNAKQHEAAIQLSKQLKQQFPGIKGFAGHKDRSHAGKIDPEGFDYNRFEQETKLPFLKSSDLGVISDPTNQRNILLAMNNQYIQNAQAGARNVYKDNPVMADIATAQAILESNLANKPSGLALKNNYFGIKGKGTAGSANMPTWEVINGKKINVKAPFAVNATPADSFTQHYNLMQKPRYKAVREAKTFEEAADAIYNAGYATDPQYPKKLKQIYLKYLKDGTSMNTAPVNPIAPPPAQPTPQEQQFYDNSVRELDQGRDDYASLAPQAMIPTFGKSNINWGLLSQLVRNA